MGSTASRVASHSASRGRARSRSQPVGRIRFRRPRSPRTARRAGYPAVVTGAGSPRLYEHRVRAYIARAVRVGLQDLVSQAAASTLAGGARAEARGSRPQARRHRWTGARRTNPRRSSLRVTDDHEGYSFTAITPTDGGALTARPATADCGGYGYDGSRRHRPRPATATDSSWKRQKTGSGLAPHRGGLRRRMVTGRNASRRRALKQRRVTSSSTWTAQTPGPPPRGQRLPSGTPNWSPDGSLIAFSEPSQTNTDGYSDPHHHEARRSRQSTDAGEHQRTRRRVAAPMGRPTAVALVFAHCAIRPPPTPRSLYPLDSSSQPDRAVLRRPHPPTSEARFPCDAPWVPASRLALTSRPTELTDTPRASGLPSSPRSSERHRHLRLQIRVARRKPARSSFHFPKNACCSVQIADSSDSARRNHQLLDVNSGRVTRLPNFASTSM